jgi:hypothetical protein
MSLRGRERSFLNLLFEVALIAIGVFVALWANNWHEDREHRAQARAALHNFAGEMEVNRQATQSNREYHVTLARELHEFNLSKEPPSGDRFEKSVHFKGIRPVIFEHTAWDLALATQALSYLDPNLAFEISNVYTKQNAFQKLEDSFLASAFTPATLSSDNFKGLAAAMEVYLNDINLAEPAMITHYERIIPKVKSAISGDGR